MYQEQVDFDDTDEEQAPTPNENVFSDVVVYGTDWTTETILSQLEKGNIQLSPRFQRRDAWDCSKKSRFVESLFLGLPVPQIVLAEKQGERGTYIVLDGKQRLLSLLQFIGKAKGKNNGFSLKGLSILEKLEGASFQKINSEPEFSGWVNAFNNQPMRSVILKNWVDVKLLHIVFVRLNTGSVALSPQELRQALYPGGFSDFVDDQASNSNSLRKLLKNKEPDFRMRDVEILVRYIAFRNFLTEYSGDMRMFLDYTCEKLNNDWQIENELVLNQVEEFEQAAEAAIQIFGIDDVARRPSDQGKRRGFNRAIFDVIIYYLSQPNIRSSSLDNSIAVKSAFSELWQESLDFTRSVELSTKSLFATSSRLILWGEKLKSVLGIDISIPIFDGHTNRIKV